jgi:hypothetical protein
MSRVEPIPSNSWKRKRTPEFAIGVFNWFAERAFTCTTVSNLAKGLTLREVDQPSPLTVCNRPRNSTPRAIARVGPKADLGE